MSSKATVVLKDDEKSALARKNVRVSRRRELEEEEEDGGDETTVMGAEPNLITSMTLGNLECDGTQLLVARIALGSNVQEFLVALDTTSNDLWVTSMDCDETCEEQSSLFDKDASDTFAEMDDFDGPNVRGKVVTDLLQMGSLAVRDEAFVSAATFKDDFSLCEEISGVAGLSKVGGFAQEIARAVKFPIFSLYVKENYDVPDPDEASEPGQLVLGGVDMGRYDGCLRWSEANAREDADGENGGIDADDYWNFRIDAVAVGDKTLENDDNDAAVVGIVDSTSRRVAGPINAVREYAAANGMTCLRAKEDEGEDEEVDCATEVFERLTVDCTDKTSDDFSSLTFVVDGEPFEFDMFSLSDLVPRGGEDDDGGILCASSVVATEDVPFWIMGVPFLSSYYTAFDVAMSRVGFAPASLKRSTPCPEDEAFDISRAMGETVNVTVEDLEMTEDDMQETWDEDENVEDENDRFADEDEDEDEDFEDEDEDEDEDFEDEDEDEDEVFEDEDEDGSDGGLEGDVEDVDQTDMTEEMQPDIDDDVDLLEPNPEVDRNFDPDGNVALEEADGLASSAIEIDDGDAHFRSSNAFLAQIGVASLVALALVAYVRRKRRAAKEKADFLKYNLGDMSFTESDRDQDIELFRMDKELEIS